MGCCISFRKNICEFENCQNTKMKNSTVCYSHSCRKPDCRLGRLPGYSYCEKHQFNDNNYKSI